MTVRDVIVQLGVLMVAAGAVLAVWGLLSGRLHATEGRRSRRADDVSPR